MAIRMDNGTAADFAVTNHVIRFDSRVVAQADFAFEHGIDIYEYVFATSQLAPNIHSRRISEADTLFHQCFNQLQLTCTLGFGFLFLVACSHYLHLIQGIQSVNDDSARMIQHRLAKAGLN